MFNYSKLISNLVHRLQTLIPKSKTSVVFVFIIVIAATLRFSGLQPGYPPYHSDETVSYQGAYGMLTRRNLQPEKYGYPALIPEMNAAIILLTALPISFALDWLSGTVTTVLSYPHSIDILNYLHWSRIITAIFGIGVVMLSYFVSNQYLRKVSIGLVASFLVATNYRQVLNSHFGLPDIYNAFFYLLALYVIGGVSSKSPFKYYLLIGIVLGLSVSTKFQVFAIPPFVIMHAIRNYNLKRSFLSNGYSLILDKRFISAMLIVPFILVFTNTHYIFHDWAKFVHYQTVQAHKYKVGLYEFSYYGLYYLINYSLGVGVTVFLALGSILMAWRERVSFTVFMSCIVPFFFVLFYYTGGGFYVRNQVSIIPVLEILVAYGIVTGVEIVGKRLKLTSLVQIIIVSAIVFLISISHIVNSLAVVKHYSEPTGLYRAEAWMRENIKPGTRVGIHSGDIYPHDIGIVPVDTSLDQLFSLAEMREKQIEYAYLNLEWRRYDTYWWMSHDEEKYQFFRKPLPLLERTYQSASTNELVSYTVASFIKAWQAPDINMVMVKIPPKPLIGKDEILAEYNFDFRESYGGWSIVLGNKVNSSSNLPIEYDGENGYVNFQKRTTDTPLTIATSPALEVTVGEGLLLEGKMKYLSDSGTRDGLLRIDYFESLDDVKRFSPISSSLSARPYANNQWELYDVRSIVPVNAHYATVSIQVVDIKKGSVSFDDLVLYRDRQVDQSVMSSSRTVKMPEVHMFPASQDGL